MGSQPSLPARRVAALTTITHAMLDPQLKATLLDAHTTLLQSGELLSQEKLSECYARFRAKFGPAVLGGLQGEALLNLMHARPSKESLVYWLEFKDDDEFPGCFGSIAGGSALKFGFYWRQESGTWLAGNPQKQSQITPPEAIALATQQRDQLLVAVELIEELPPNATDAAYAAYAALQQKLDELCPKVSANAWGHKYLSLLFPAKLDDYHNADYQRFHLIKLHQTPPALDGLYAAAGQYVRIAEELQIPLNHLTTILNRRNGKPHSYWRVGTSIGEQTSIWPQMKAGNFVAIGWPELGDLKVKFPGTSVDGAIAKVIQNTYGTIPNVASRKAREIQSFFLRAHVGDLVLAADGRKILGVGRVTGAYRFEPATLSTAPHQLPVEWLAFDPWPLPADEGLQTTFVALKKPENCIAAERHIPTSPAQPTPSPAMLTPAPDVLPLNIILYGPPGTGKTHRLRNEYMEKVFTDRKAVLSAEEQACSIVKDRAWWEVAALALLDASGNQATVAQILQHPLVQARLKLSANSNPGNSVWAALQSHAREDCLAVKYSNRSDPLIFAKDEDSVWSLNAKLVLADLPELGEVLNRFRSPPQELAEVRRYKFTTFHQSFSYEDFVEGIKPQTVNGQITYEVRDGIFKQACQEAALVVPKPYALFIDEINRGNVASIFGELITLIEDDKRLGAANQLTPELPYSRQAFGVPRNLHVIGTMNTADRSVEALDTALRRRFTFVEMRSDPGCIVNSPSLDVDLGKLLTAMNARIEQLLDHDHCIGHAYFMSVNDLPALRKVFANKIIPLLREYFYGCPAKIGMVLGERFVTRESSKLPFAGGSWGAGELDEKDVYSFTEPSTLNEADFQTVYAQADSGI